MKFSILTLVATLAFATAAPSELVARQCSCHKVGDEWICSGRLCPKDFVPEPAMVKRDTELVARQCSCKKVGNEWICSGRLCP
ncbi:hypothetical protein CcaCcLH18_08972 [Colletotrichum camelliae]|nr:hypothetical protein CcaCcLH18_08972 [Colletotrichum camelliae]